MLKKKKEIEEIEMMKEKEDQRKKANQKNLFSSKIVAFVGTLPKTSK